MPPPPNKFHELVLRVGILGVFFLVIAGVWVVWKVPQWEVQHSLDSALRNDRAKQLELEDNFRKTIMQCLGGAIVLLGLYYSARTFGLSRQGHITDRFTKAVEQLGKVDGNNPNIEVRLGGIYALERVATDSIRDFGAITKILTAYVRRNSPLDPTRPYTEGEEPRTDIQAILTVFGQPATGERRELLRLPLDLSNTRLCGAKLNNLNLRGADLTSANLQGAYLNDVDLRGANLGKANLQGATLHSTNLQRANLGGANLQDANLQGSYLLDAYLQDVNLRGATLPSGRPYEETIEPDASPEVHSDKPTEDT